MTSTVRQQQQVLVVVLVVNGLVAAAKLTVGAATGAISMVADGVHSLTDAASNVVGLVGVSLAARPPDATHPYGHKKFETLAAMVIGGLLAMTAWEILSGSVSRLRSGDAPEVVPMSFAVMIVSIGVNLALSTWERRRGRELDSDVLKADSEHTLSDVYTSLAVIGSLVAARLGMPRLDAVAAIFITLIIARTAFRVLRSSAIQLADTAFVPVDEIERLALTVPGVESVHKIRTRGAPPNAHADLHVQLDPALRLDQAHVIGHLVAERLQTELGLRDVVAHVEPSVGHRTTWRPGAD